MENATEKNTSKKNFVRFKESFEIKAKQYGDGGRAWERRGEPNPIDLQEPDWNDPAYGWSSDNELKREMFLSDRKRYQEKLDKTKRELQALCGVLMGMVDDELSDKLRADEEFDRIYKAQDLIELWKLVEKHGLGQTKNSGCLQISKLLHMEQGKGQFIKYMKEYKDGVAAILAQWKGKESELLTMIFDTKFLLGVDQEQFKDQLSAIYSLEKWPTLNESSAQLARVVTTKANLESMRKEETDVQVSAMKAAMKAEKGAKWDKAAKWDKGGKRGREKTPPRDLSLNSVTAVVPTDTARKTAVISSGSVTDVERRDTNKICARGSRSVPSRRLRRH